MESSPPLSQALWQENSLKIWQGRSFSWFSLFFWVFRDLQGEWIGGSPNPPLGFFFSLVLTDPQGITTHISLHDSNLKVRFLSVTQSQKAAPCTASRQPEAGHGKTHLLVHLLTERFATSTPKHTKAFCLHRSQQQWSYFCFHIIKFCQLFLNRKWAQLGEWERRNPETDTQKFDPRCQNLHLMGWSPLPLCASPNRALCAPALQEMHHGSAVIRCQLKPSQSPKLPFTKDIKTDSTEHLCKIFYSLCFAFLMGKGGKIYAVVSL